MIRTFNGSCHCGAIGFRCDIDLGEPTSRCNCSICTKTRLWKTMAQPGSFRFLRGADAVAIYRFAGQRIEHRFCRHCGVKLGGHGAKGPHFPHDFDVVSIACLDDMGDDVKAALSVVYQDGRHDDWANAPRTPASL
jgi:hypothetical protein